MKFLAPLLLILGITSTAAADCVFKRDIRGYRVRGDNLILQALGREYVADVGYCSDLRWARRIAFDTFRPNWVCDGDRVLTYLGNTRYPSERCRIWSLERRR